MTIFIQERLQTGATRRLSATEVFNYLNQNNIRSQLTNNLAVENIIPKTGMTNDQYKQYLENPPAGKRNNLFLFLFFLFLWHRFNIAMTMMM